MGVGPNYVLDKGLVATGATAYKFGEFVALSGDGTKCARATTANTAIGVCYEDLDTTRLATGKAVIEVRLLGIARVLSGDAVAVGARVSNDTTARAVTATAGASCHGVALTAATGAGEYIDVLLSPGATA